MKPSYFVKHLHAAVVCYCGRGTSPRMTRPFRCSCGVTIRLKWRKKGILPYAYFKKFNGKESPRFIEAKAAGWKPAIEYWDGGDK